MIKALVFDFDGLILETELPILQSWQELYRSYGFELTLDTWSAAIGTLESPFDPHQDLEMRAGRPIPWGPVGARRRERELELILRRPLQPGVMAYLQDARRLGLRLGVASSSPHEWVDGHLKRLGLWEYFQAVCCAGDAPLTKPDPGLYLAALKALQVHPEQAVALEDSPNGALAACRAGMFCVTVPTEITRQLPFGEVDLVLESLADLPLAELLTQLEALSRRNGKC